MLFSLRSGPGSAQNITPNSFSRPNYGPPKPWYPPGHGLNSNLTDLQTRDPHVMQYCFPAGNRTSRPDFGRATAGKEPKSAPPSAQGRPIYYLIRPMVCPFWLTVPTGANREPIETKPGRFPTLPGCFRQGPGGTQYI